MWLTWLLEQIFYWFSYKYHLHLPPCYTLTDDIDLEDEKEYQYGLNWDHYEDLYFQTVKVFNKRIIGKGTSASMESRNQKMITELAIFVKENYKGWTEETTFMLFHSFLDHCDVSTATINLSQLSSLIGSTGYDVNQDKLLKLFNRLDDGNGQLRFEDFLKVVYIYDPQDDSGILTGLAEYIRIASWNVAFATKLEVGHQLEYGLY